MKIVSEMETIEDSRLEGSDGSEEKMCNFYHVSVSPIILRTVQEIVKICFSLQYRKGFREGRNGSVKS